MKNTLRSLAYLKNHWLVAAGALLSMLLVNAANLFSPQVLRYLIDEGIRPNVIFFLFFDTAKSNMLQEGRENSAEHILHNIICLTFLCFFANFKFENKMLSACMCCQADTNGP